MNASPSMRSFNRALFDLTIIACHQRKTNARRVSNSFGQQNGLQNEMLQLKLCLAANFKMLCSHHMLVEWLIGSELGALIGLD